MSAGPTPDSISIFGVAMAPALTTTSSAAPATALLPRQRVLDSDGAAAFEPDPLDERVGQDFEIGTAPGRTEVGAGRRVPEAPAHVSLSVSDALLALAVVVVKVSVAGRMGGGDERVGDLMLGPHHGDLDGSIGASIWVAPLEALCSEEIWLDAFPVPSLAPQVGPAVEVARMTADPNDTVDRAAATHHPPGHPWRRGAAT